MSDEINLSVQLATKIKIKILRDALLFYGTKQKWDFYCDCCANGTTPLEKDHGKRADDALKVTE